jgi:hypothetical protein
MNATCNMINTKSNTFSLNRCSLVDRDSVPRSTRNAPVSILDTTTQQHLYLPGRIHSWTTVLVS